MQDNEEPKKRGPGRPKKGEVVITKRKKPKKKKPTRPVGRPKIHMPFNEARELVRNEGIGSFSQYRLWWKLNTPARIPKRPDRTYNENWKGWNDFLDNNNRYPCVKKTFRAFNEAKTYAQQLGLASKAEWISYAKGNKKPKDIPSRPDLAYRNDWFTWKDFLGADAVSRKRNIEEYGGVFFIIRNAGRPHNVYQMGITLEGVDAITSVQSQQQFQIIAMFKCEITFPWEIYLSEYGTKYWESGREDEFKIANIGEFIFAIDDDVEKIN